MTAGEAVARAVRQWVDEKRTGFLIFNFRGGVLTDLEHQVKEFVERPRKPPLHLGSATGPACPGCGSPLASRDGGAMWVCGACALKRTQHQMRQEGMLR